jgi:hypothetical protein
MEKSVGFRRDIRAAWFDAAAAFRAESTDLAVLRRRLDDSLTPEIPGPENRALTIGILLRIWGKGDQVAPDLHAEALDRFVHAERPSDRVWLHYGLSLIAFPFFFDAVTIVGQMERRNQSIGRAALKAKLIEQRGPLGSLTNATKAVLFALKQWEMLVPAERRGTYLAAPPRASGERGLEAWLLACALQAYPGQALPFPDLIALPCLFPFQLSLNPDDLRRDGHFELDRQGGGWDLVRRAAR